MSWYYIILLVFAGFYLVIGAVSHLILGWASGEEGTLKTFIKFLLGWPLLFTNRN